MLRCNSPRLAASARAEDRLLRPALQHALMLAGLGQLALGLDHRFIQLGVPLLRGGKL